MSLTDCVVNEARRIFTVANQQWLNPGVDHGGILLSQAPQIFRRNTRFAGTVIRPDNQVLPRFGGLVLGWEDTIILGSNHSQIYPHNVMRATATCGRDPTDMSEKRGYRQTHTHTHKGMPQLCIQVLVV